MASTYSSNLKIELMGTGENSGTWGNITNTNLGTAFEQAVVGLGNPDYLSDANLTITITNSNAAQAARALVLNVTSSFGSLSTTRELVVPTIQKQYIVQNNTTGGQSITVKTSGGTGITVPNGRKAHLYVDGVNVIQMFDFVDINGGTIDGTAIGGAAAAAAAFTTLTASGATTLNGAVALGDAAADLITVPGTINSNLLFTDATYDIGASGATRPRDMFLSRNLTVGGTLTLAGGVNLNGNVTVGDAATDTLTINSTITSNLIFTDNTYDIGASGATRPRSLFLAGNITAAGSQTLTGALTVDSTTDSTSATTGSIQTDGGVGIAKALFVGTTVTVNGGTANGVAYLNASKVLTTGSALTFDGTTVGINTAVGNSTSLSITGDYTPNNTATFIAVQRLGGAVAGAWSYNDAQGAIQFGTTTNHALVFLLNNTEKARFTNDGVLLVGKNSNATYAAGGALFAVNGGTDNGVSIAQSQSTGPFMTFFDSANSGYASISQPAAGTLSLSTSTALRFDVNSAQRMNISSAGYVGINTSTSTLSQYLTIGGSGGTLAGTAAIALWDANSGGSRRWAIANGASAAGDTQIGMLTFNVGSGNLNADPLSAGLEVMRLTFGGNVCVGSSSAGSAGSINVSVGNPGVTAGGLQLWSPTNTAHYVQFGDGTSGTDPYRGFVGYAHASDALVFGTATTERARIDSSGNFGVGLTAPSAIIHSYSTNLGDGGGLKIQNGGSGGATFAIWPTATVNGEGAGKLIISGPSGNAVALDSSGNFGIGTVSPQARLHLLSNGEVLRVGTSTSGYISWYRGATWAGYIDAESGGNMNFAVVGANALTFSANSAERARITGAGNLMVGTTTATGKLTVNGANSSIVADFNETSGVPYIRVQNGTQIIGLGVTASTGFAGTISNHAFEFRTNNTERARITSGGELLVGTTTTRESVGQATQAVQIQGAGTGGTNSGVAINSFSNNAFASNVDFFKSRGTGTTNTIVQNNDTIGKLWWSGADGTRFIPAAGIFGEVDGTPGTNDMPGRLSFYTTADGSSSVTERARISSDGTFRVRGAGTAGSTDAFQVAGTAPADAARITSGGELLVGATATASGFDGKLNVFNAGVSASFKNNVDTLPSIICWNATTSGDGKFAEFGTETSYTARGSITYNRAGGLVAYNTTSDYRAKDISGPVTGSGALIDSVPVYMGKMKGATQERPMFIAHEVPAYAHTGVKDAVDDDGNPVYQQMDASALIPVMWAEIQSLRARLAAANI